MTEEQKAIVDQMVKDWVCTSHPEAVRAFRSDCERLIASRVAEIERLNRRISELDEVNAMHQRHMGNTEYVTRVALDCLWDMLGAKNQTEAVSILGSILNART